MISEQVVAALVGAAVVGALKIIDRMLDWWFPSDHHSKRVETYGVKDNEEEQ